MTREALGQHAADLQQAGLPLAHGRQGERVAYDRLPGDRRVLVAAAAVGIDDAQVLHHAVVVDDAFGRAAEDRGGGGGEVGLGDGLGGQLLPAAAVQQVDVGEAQVEAALGQGPHQRRPQDRGEAVDQAGPGAVRVDEGA